jgi:hypothetical protein
MSSHNKNYGTANSQTRAYCSQNSRTNTPAGNFFKGGGTTSRTNPDPFYRVESPHGKTVPTLSFKQYMDIKGS